MTWNSRSADFALLTLRVWLGAYMLVLHGVAKITKFADLSTKFPDPFGIGSKGSLILAIFAEVVCSALLVLGLFTRIAALGNVVTMAIAFFVVHKYVLKPGPGSGELAFIYLAGFVAIFFAGAGRFSLDSKFAAPQPKFK